MRRSTTAPRGRGNRVESIHIAANRYIVRHYPFGCLGGMPRALTIDRRKLWLVSILLTSPGQGVVGEVGVVALDARGSRVVGSTPRQGVADACQQLRENHRDALEAAFHRARTV